MATKDQLFANRFFKAEAFKKPLVVEIDHCVVEPLKNNEGITKEKLVIFFTDQKQQLVCNSSNFDSIADVTGEMDTDVGRAQNLPVSDHDAARQQACPSNPREGAAGGSEQGRAATKGTTRGRDP